MKLALHRHLWGVTEPWDTVFPRIKSLGFAGIEAGLPAADHRGRLRDLLDQHGFSFIPQIFTGGGNSVDDHLASFRRQVDEARALGPLLINAHSGRDFWSAADSLRFYTEALAIEFASGITVTHETHRGRCFYSPWVTRPVLEALPALKLTADFSHWVVVAGRLLDVDLDTVRLAARHTHHLHARVGYEEGPQVPDPRAPEYQRHVEAHERWWDLVWDAQQARGQSVSTLTPEFGPPAYLHTLPYSNVPVANLWDICTSFAQRQAERFNHRTWPAQQAAR